MDNPFYGNREFYTVKYIYWRISGHEYKHMVDGIVTVKNRVLYFKDDKDQDWVLSTEGANFINYNNERSYIF